MLAQQQINNDGATASDLQQQVGSETIQQNSGAQQASDITQNAGAAVVQNAPNQPLDVTGAPATTATDESRSGFRWVIIFGLFLAILLSPALLYIRDLQQAGDVTDDVLLLKAPKEAGKQAVEEEEVSQEKQTAQPVKKKPGAKAKSKKIANKTKRGKKSHK